MDELKCIRCEVHTNVMVGKSGKCHRRDICGEQGSEKCGETILFQRKIKFLEEAREARKVR
ncbi:MAG: hypothetical protein AM325_015995 [Candidatus Thorarchaeota archaeon SMTZ1-45]|nr:MAG: hypothetical protein AM325_16795 [Candidatus Thorarchaeota archaeon SMTZ1-45]